MKQSLPIIENLATGTLTPSALMNVIDDICSITTSFISDVNGYIVNKQKSEEEKHDWYRRYFYISTGGYTGTTSDINDSSNYAFVVDCELFAEPLESQWSVLNAYIKPLIRNARKALIESLPMIE